MAHICTQLFHHGQDATQGQFYKWSKSLNSEFPFTLTGCLTKAKEPNLPFCFFFKLWDKEMYLCLSRVPLHKVKHK